MKMSTTDVVALVVAACACGIDLRTRRIPNLLTFGTAATALVFHFVVGGVPGLAASGAGWGVGMAMLIVPYALGGMGAGDVKLLAALGAWIGPADVARAGAYGAVAGALMALAVSLMYGYLREAVKNVFLMLMEWRIGGLRPLPEMTLATSRGPRLAYAAPILVGTMAMLWLR
jgi:prepilin peptidase CpaA